MKNCTKNKINNNYTFISYDLTPHKSRVIRYTYNMPLRSNSSVSTLYDILNNIGTVQRNYNKDN